MQPVLLRIPWLDWQITSSGASLVVAAFVAYTLTLGLASRAGVSRALASSACFVAAVGGVLMARVSYVAVNLDTALDGSSAAARHWLAWITVRDGGLLGYAGLLGGWGLGALWLRFQVAPVAAWRWLDSTAPGALLGAAVVRIGCYVFGCDYGRPLPPGASAWQQRLGSFPRWAEVDLHGAGAPAWADQVRAALIPPEATHSLPVHATQLYAAALSLVVFGSLVWLGRRLKAPGQLFGAALMALATTHFCVEIWRADPDRGLLGPSLEAKLLLGLGLVTLGLLACAGPARVVREARRRSAVYLLLLAPGGLWLLVRAASGLAWDVIPVSAAQWLALISAAVGALGVRWAPDGAEPVGAAASPSPEAQPIEITE
ncbi:MAG: prolipoprotein diacylglyceryl transferase [Polyangiaceae bacterium]|nr:prolipoprotein diacylglyceryl transferase [Polyangiaceae bacterium]MCW5792085.1 prolipoprotein diacylglyceryl transferase [Polyangiaceae bacterium]